MITKECLIAPLAVLGFTFSSQIAVAAEKSDAGFLVTAWPLIVLSIILVIFRKQLIIQSTPEPHDSDHHEPEAEKKATTTKTTHETVTKAVKDKPSPKPKRKPKKQAATANGTIDLKDDSNQCQAATAKGTRCKRSSSLENATVSLNGKTYKLTVCSQHNNDSLQIFSDLIK